MPKVSIIIPNYNHAEYLIQRIDSVLNQSYSDFEVIFLDDASTDNSKEVFRRFESDVRIVKTIFNPLNSGSAFKQWDKGIAEAKGEYIWIAESDDYADSEFLRRLVQVLDDNPTVGLVYSNSYFLKNGAVLNSPRAEKWMSDFVHNGQEELKNNFILRCVIPTASATLFRKSLYLRAGGVDTGMKSAGDWLLWVKILLISDLGFVSVPLNYFRSLGTSARAVSIKSGLAVYEYLKVSNFIKDNVHVPAEKLNDAVRIFFRYWVHNAHVHKFTFKMQCRIFEELRHFMPGRFSSFTIILFYFLTSVRYRIRLRTRIREIIRKIKL